MTNIDEIKKDLQSALAEMKEWDDKHNKDKAELSKLESQLGGLEDLQSEKYRYSRQDEISDLMPKVNQYRNRVAKNKEEYEAHSLNGGLFSNVQKILNAYIYNMMDEDEKLNEIHEQILVKTQELIDLNKELLDTSDQKLLGLRKEVIDTMGYPGMELNKIGSYEPRLKFKVPQRSNLSYGSLDILEQYKKVVTEGDKDYKESISFANTFYLGAKELINKRQE